MSGYGMSQVVYSISKYMPLRAREVVKKPVQYPASNLHLDVNKPMIGHCDQWHIIDRIPFISPCCNKLILAEK